MGWIEIMQGVIIVGIVGIITFLWNIQVKLTRIEIQFWAIQQRVDRLEKQKNAESRIRVIG